MDDRLYLAAVLIFWLVAPFFIAARAREVGRSPWRWALASLLISPVLAAKALAWLEHKAAPSVPGPPEPQETEWAAGTPKHRTVALDPTKV